MNVAKSPVVGVSNIIPSYEEIEKSIAIILKRRHKLTAMQADEAIRISPLKSVFQSDPEMAAHTSNEAWAREILAYWKKSTNN